MKVLVKDIPDEGTRIEATLDSAEWLRQVVSEVLVGFRKGDEGADLKVDLFRTGRNVSCKGSLHCKISGECSRCLAPFQGGIVTEINLTLAPVFESEAQSAKELAEEVELTEQDLEFSYYEGGSFDLGNLVREHLILGLPMQSLCDENCKGLCGECGTDLNKAGCSCQKQKVDNRWELLKLLKLDE